ncbi:MAG TPA: DsbA family protein [Actinomycetes bacterium]|nr:DsbA family protein [Actinomycetes bacterium]
MSVVIYGDFTCPYSYLASRRTDALIEAGVDVDWHAVERRPDLPVTGVALTPDSRAALEAEVAEVTELLRPGEELPLEIHGTIPRTEAAVSGYAEAYGVGTAADVRRLLFRTYWVEGGAIGDPEVLRQLLVGPILRGDGGAGPLHEFGYAVAVSRGPMTTAAFRHIQAWRAGWVATGTGTTPTVVVDGTVHAGVAGLHWLADEIDRLGAPRAPEPAEPSRYPEVSLRPQPEWVSTVGGPWARAFMHR